MQSAASGSAVSYRVLVVEDEGLIAHDISRRLESLGHEVVAAVSTAEEAIALAAGADLVLMDIHIDGARDGIEAALEIRNRYRVPVVFLTAHADRATLDRAKTAGPFGYVVKPLGPASLHTAIEMATYKHRSERALEEREAWYRATLDSAADAVIAVDVGGRVRTLNQAASALTGWSSEQAAGQRLDAVVRLVEERTGEAAGDLVARALLRDAPLTMELALGADGRVVEGSAAPVKTLSETLGAVLTLREVTTRRWEERQLRQCQRMEAAGRLAASISADYGTLLAAIRNQAARLLEQFGEYSPARNAVEAIHQAAAAADQLTRRLSLFGTRQVAQRQLMSLNRVVRHLLKLIESVAGAGTKVMLRLAPESGQAQVDPALMEQAIMNLVIHACAAVQKSGRDGGRLLFETKKRGTSRPGNPAVFVVLALEYSAAEADLEHLFDPAASGDTGLALPVAHSIVTEHNGFLTARASPGDGGTCIELLLPLAEEADTPREMGEPVERVPAVLLVDSREAVRADLHNFFELAGFNLLEAADRDEAVTLGQLHEGPLDLVIADSAAADALLEALRGTHPALAVLRVVDAPERSRLEIRRPFTQQALVERVRQILGEAERPRGPKPAVEPLAAAAPAV